LLSCVTSSPPLPVVHEKAGVGRSLFFSPLLSEPQGEPRGRSGGDNEAGEPAATWRRPASPVIVRPRSMSTTQAARDSNGARVDDPRHSVWGHVGARGAGRRGWGRVSGHGAQVDRE